MEVKPHVSYLVTFDSTSDSVKRLLPKMYPESLFYEFSQSLYSVAREIMLELYSDRWLKIGKGERDVVTSGCVGMFLAMSFCGSVEAFEMAPSEHANDAPYNYYGRHLAADSAVDNDE